MFNFKLWAMPWVKLYRLDKPVGIWLLLWPALWGLWLAAQGAPPWPVFVVFVLGVVLMRSAGCAINDYADKDFDLHVKRTQHRPVTTGLIQPRQALWAAGIAAGLAFLLVLMLVFAVVFGWSWVVAHNMLANVPTKQAWLFLLYCVPAVLLAASYPFTKRFLVMPQAYLGVAFGFSILMAHGLLQGQWSQAAMLAFAVNVLWTIAYDTQYAMVDKPDDVHLGIHTSAIFFGRFDAHAVAACYAGAWLLWAALPVWGGLDVQHSYWFWAMWVLAGIWACWMVLLSFTHNAQKCFEAFQKAHWFGGLLWLSVV